MTVRLRWAAMAAIVFAWSFVIQAQHSVSDSRSHYVRDSRRAYDHGVSDSRASGNHYRRDAVRDIRHTFRDLTVRSNTHSSSSPRRDYYDRRQQNNHYRADRYRSYDHAVRDLRGSSYHYSRQTTQRRRPAHQTTRRH